MQCVGSGPTRGVSRMQRYDSKTFACELARQRELQQCGRDLIRFRASSQRNFVGPVPGQAAAIDALLAVRDPFRVQGIPDFWPNVVDRNTRVAFYVRNLQLNPGEMSSSVFVRFINGFSVVASVPAEDVRPIPNSEFTQVVVRLPNNLPPNTYTIQILAHSRLSNTGTIRIIP